MKVSSVNTGLNNFLVGIRAFHNFCIYFPQTQKLSRGEEQISGTEPQIKLQKLPAHVLATGSFFLILKYSPNYYEINTEEIIKLKLLHCYLDT